MCMKRTKWTRDKQMYPISDLQTFLERVKNRTDINLYLMNEILEYWINYTGWSVRRYNKLMPRQQIKRMYLDILRLADKEK